ncbi:piggyBac transposable element-derived protein 3-like [Macrobrachium rosenbergii]|uniref:piggyBac transposable element-derived protein 3-like n=1 Tax=Macrobrachium rosenbergii TaxID=79674 RepID=UPI0034D57BE6
MEQIDNNPRQLFYGPSTADFPRTPPDIFELFLDTAAIELLTNETGKYAAQNGNHQFSLSCNEMKIFVAILLLSGYCSVSRRRLHWSTELDTHNELISNSMRRNRFEEIMRYFHAADNTDLNPDGKFAKVRPFLDILNKNYLSYGKYEGNNPNVYASEYGLGGKVVLNILDTLQAEYPGIKFSLYFDNFFTSIKLLEEIKRRGHGATGALRANRVEKCPLTINKKFEKLPRGSEEHFLEILKF